MPFFSLVMRENSIAERTDGNMGTYSGSLTREQFMFREMRMTARMRQSGMSDAEILDKVFSENLFQYPTQNEIRSKCRACLARIRLLEQVPPLPETLAEGTLGEARLAALAAMMLQNQLVEDFMRHVVGEKYRRGETSLTRGDIGLFLMETRQRVPAVAAWSDATSARIRGVLRRCLLEAEYLRDDRDDTLLPVYPSDAFGEALRRGGLFGYLPAFNILDD